MNHDARPALQRPLYAAAAAKRLGISAQTLRALEKRGLFRARRDWNGFRRYDEADLTALRRVLFPEAWPA